MVWLVVSLLAPAIPSAAQEPEGSTTAVTAESRYEVESFTLIGVEHIEEDALKSVLATRRTPWLPWGPRRYFDPEAFEVDLRRIVAYYRDHGFPDVRVVSHDVDINHDESEVAITIRVEEGEPVRVDAIAFEGFEVLSQPGPSDLRAALPVQPGDIAVQPDVLAGGELAAAALKNEGFAYAEVRVEQEETEPGRLRIRYIAEPGVRAVFGPIEVVGNASVSDEIVRRHMAYRPGELFTLRQVRESQRRLYSLALFQFATIETLQSQRPDEVPTRVTVAEADHRQLHVAGGWGTEEKLNAEVIWQHVNFYGGARALAARGKWSSLESGAELDFRQPAILHPVATLALNGHAWYADELAYRARSEGGRAALESRLSPRTIWRATYTYEFASSQISNEALGNLAERDTLIALGLDPRTGEQRGILSSVALELQHATVDDPLDPQSGYSSAWYVERAGSFLPGDYDYLNVSADLRGYLPVGERAVLAARVRGAFIDPSGPPEDVPFFKRYFLGGSTSLRGWGRFEVAPLSGSGLPLGGFSLLESSVELRTRVWGNVGLVLFADAGNVWRDAWQVHPADLRYDVGPGLRYQTPVGPVRVDLAYQLTPIEGLRVDGHPQERRWRVHFSIGQSF